MRSLCLWTLFVFEQRIIMVFLCVCVCVCSICVCVCVFASSLCVLERPAARAVFYMCVPHVIARMRVTPVSDVFKFGSSF